MPGGAGPCLDRVFSAVGERVLPIYPGDEEGRMLRSPGLKTAGKVYAFATAADLVVKLPSSRVDELVDSGRGLVCSPRPGRPMKEWVRIPAPDEVLSVLRPGGAGLRLGSRQEPRGLGS